MTPPDKRPSRLLCNSGLYHAAIRHATFAPRKSFEFNQCVRSNGNSRCMHHATKLLLSGPWTSFLPGLGIHATSVWAFAPNSRGRLLGKFWPLTSSNPGDKHRKGLHHFWKGLSKSQRGTANSFWCVLRAILLESQILYHSCSCILGSEKCLDFCRTCCWSSKALGTPTTSRSGEVLQLQNIAWQLVFLIPWRPCNARTR